MTRTVVILCLLLICLQNHVYGQEPNSTTTTANPNQAKFKFSSGKAKITGGHPKKLPPTKVKPTTKFAGVDMGAGMLPPIGPTPSHLTHKGRIPITGQKVVGGQKANAVPDTFILPPITGSKLAKHPNFPKAQKKPGFTGAPQDALAMSGSPQMNSVQPVGFNDVFHLQPTTPSNHIPVAKSELVLASTLFDKQTGHVPSNRQNSQTWLRYAGKPISANPLVSFISINNKHKIAGTNNGFSFKSAVLISNRPPLNHGNKMIGFKNWIDLTRYRKNLFKTPYSGRAFTNTPSGRLMSLLEAGSVPNFMDQFKYYVGTNNQRTRPANRPVTVLDSLLSDMDLNADPCGDFYQFACGGFIANSTRRNGVTSKLTEAKDQVVRSVAWVLEQKPIKVDPEALVKGKQFYQSCMNEKAIEMRGLTSLRNFLSDRGGWPVLGLWDPRRFSLADQLARTRSLLRDYSTHYLPTGTIIGMTIQRDFMKPGTHAIYLDQPSLGQLNFGGMPNNEVYKLGKDIIYNKAYEDYLVDIAIALGANVKVARRDMCDVVNFERKLADIMMPETDRRMVEKRYRLVSILEMSLRYPYFDWFHFIQQVLYAGNSRISVKLSDKVVVWASPYFDRLGKVLSKTPKRVLANYVLFRAIQHMLPATNRLMQYVNLRYIAVVNGATRPQLPQRSEFCARLAVEHMDWLASRIYVESRLDRETLDQATVIQGFVKQTLAGLIENASWLDRQTKQAQLLKLDAMKDRTALPKKLLNDKLVNEYYRDANITQDLFENMETLLNHNYIRLLNKLSVTPKDDWVVRPSDLRIMYNSGANAVEIPAAFLQQPFLDLQYSQALNYGGIGTVIAQAYAHAFDVSGMKFDWNGILKRIWSNQASYRYGIRANCFVNQYSNYYLPDADLLVVNGNKTLNGNIRDNIAVKTGYYAYKVWKSTNQNQERVNLPFTDEQLYFINYARQMCHNASPTYTRKLPYSRLTSVPRLRVIGPLQNSWEFSSAFQCTLGTQMNPRDKCYFW